MNTPVAVERDARIIKLREVMKIKIDCKFMTGKFEKDVCLLHSKEDHKEKCCGECEDCKKNEEDYGM